MEETDQKACVYEYIAQEWRLGSDAIIGKVKVIPQKAWTGPRGFG